MRILILFPLCISLSIVKDIGSYSLFPQSVIFAPLLDYFSGYSLNYSIMCTPNLENSSIIQSSNFSIADQKVWSETLPKAKIPFYKMPSRWVGNNAFSFYFATNEVVWVEVDQVTGELKEFWKIALQSDLFDFSLLYIEAILLSTEIIRVVAIGKGYKNIEVKNEIHVIEFNPSTKLYESKLVIVPELESLEIFGISNSLFTSYVSFNTNSGVYVFDCVSINELKMIQIIDTVYSIPYFDAFPLLPKFIIIDNKTGENMRMVVLDNSSNLILYNFSEYQFIEVSSISLTEYGDMFDIDMYNLERINLGIICVATSTGTLLVDIDNMQEIKMLSNYSTKSNKGVFSAAGFVFTLAVDTSSNSLFLSIKNVDYPGSVMQEYQISYNEIDISGPWAFIQLVHEISILRIDSYSATIVNTNAVLPQIRITMDDQIHDCNITATELGKSLSNPMKLSPLSNSLYDVSLGSQGKPWSNSLAIKFVLTEQSSLLQLPIYMFNGWNLTCSIQLERNDSSYFTIQDLTPEKVSLLYSIETKQSSSLFLGGYIVNILEEYIEIMSFSGNGKKTFFIPKGIDACYSNQFEDFELLVFLQENEKDCNIVLLTLNNGACKNYTFSTISECEQIEIVSNYLIVSGKIGFCIYKVNSNKIILLSLIFSKLISDIRQIATLTDDLLNDNSFLYLAFSDYILIYDLNTYNMVPINYTDSNIRDSKYISTGNSQVFIVTSTKVMVYDTLFNNLYTEILLSVEKIFVLDNFFLGVNMQDVYLINSTELILIEAGFYTGNYEGETFGLAYETPGNAVFGVKTAYSIKIYSSLCPGSIENCSKSLTINLSVKILELLSNENSETGLITCKNNKDTFIKAIKISTITYGLTVSSSYKQLESKFFYNYSLDYFTYDFFKGLDLQIDLYINSEMVQFGEKAPITLLPPVYLSSSSMLSKQVLSFIHIPGQNKIASLTNEGKLIIFDSDDLKVLSEFNLKGGVIEKCYKISLIFSQQVEILLVLSCLRLIFSETYFVEKNYFLFISFTELYKYQILSMYQISFQVSSVQSLAVDTQKFLLGCQEKVETDSSINNHIQVFEGIWNASGVFLEQLPIINFVSLKLMRFYSVSIRVNYNYKREIEIYSADFYWGLRIIKFDRKLYQFVESQNFQIKNSIANLGLCGKLIIIGCNDTSVVIFHKSNNKFVYSFSYYPYSNKTEQYSLSGSGIECNNFYQPRYFLLPIVSGNVSILRVFDLHAEFSSAILRDIIVSYSISIYGIVYHFTMNDFFYFFDIEENRLDTYKIQESKISIPSFDDKDYSVIEKKFGEKFTYAFNVSNGASFYFTPNYEMNRGKISHLSTGTSSSISIWFVALIIVAVLLMSILIVFCVYKYLWKRRKQKEKIELVVNRISFDYSMN